MIMVLLMDVVQRNESKIQSVLVYLSNGGAYHNMTQLSVHCGIIWVCLLLEIDYAVFVCTIPGHSCSNMAEIVILILNLAFQGLYLARAAKYKGNERMMKRCSGLSEIRAAAKNSVDF